MKNHFICLPMKSIMKLAPRIVLFFILIGTVSCSVFRKGGNDNKLNITFIHINDVYEIAPLAGGTQGGMARVATLKKKYKAKNPNTLLVIGGDFLSPSVYNSLQYEGKAIRGKQMVESMNAAGMDLAVFGNHEFDIKEVELQQRINESRFQWIATNAFHLEGNELKPFTKNDSAFPKTYIMNLRDADGTTARIGFMGIVLPFNKADYVSYTDPLKSAREAYNMLKDSVDAVIAITHQAVYEDSILAKEIPGLALILGGHEHDMRFLHVGNIYIAKAHANAKSAYVIDLTINKKKRSTQVKPKLVYLDETVAPDSATNVVVQKWTGIANNNYKNLGFDAAKVVMDHNGPLDGRETEIRSHATNLTQLIMSSVKEAVPTAEVVLMNAGSIRVDDFLQMPLTEYDIIRTMPFGGSIREADMKGSLLIKTLDQGKKNRGNGGFLQYNNEVTLEGGTWKIRGEPIIHDKTYHVGITEFLLTGKEANLEFLNPSNPDIIRIYKAETSNTDPRSDVRLALVSYLEKHR
jgi:2',3'-cyclic-nucleotide 2'-phosphodiesterase (5'-nucleotidase family)